MQKQKRSSYNFVIVLVFILALCIPTKSAQADMVPKPSMDFYFRNLTNGVSVIEGQLLLCNDKACNEFTVFDGSFACVSDHCWAFSTYPIKKSEQFTEFHKIKITFTDGVRESNVFTKQGFSAQYDVQVMENDLIVEEKFDIKNFFNPLFLICFSGAAIMTIVIETITAMIYIKIIRADKSLIWRTVMANVASLPIVWILLSNIFNSDQLIGVLVIELFAFLFEAAFIALTCQRYGITIKKALFLSFIMNFASFSIESLILLVLIN